jgi:PKD repeat protein
MFGHAARKWIAGLLVGATSTISAQAVLFKSTADPSYNTNAPTGSLTNSGWQYEGDWSSYLGTPIAPTYFITASHFGGDTNWIFVLNGFAYHPVASYDDPNSDLILWEVAETFPSYAPLYTNSNEVGKHCVVFGRGTQRGAAIIVGTPPVTNGWFWGTGDGVRRWGENDVATNINAGAGVGDLLYETFTRTANSNECHLSVGDSGGALFVQDGSTWKLAGIHYAVDAPFSTNGVNGSGFEAALMDYGGLYTGGDGNWTFQSNTPADKPSGFYSTRVSSHIAWINSVINAPPVASFSGSPTNGSSPLTVTFSDSSHGPITNRFWSFGDGSTTNFAVRTNPTHTYTAGVYSVTLIVSGSGGANTNTMANLISVYAPFAWWQLQYFGCTNCAQAQPDADPFGKGISNTNQFLAGFDPTNSAAYAHIIDIAVTNTTDINVVYLGADGDSTWSPGIVSRTNVLEFTAGAADGSYSNNFATTGLTNIFSGGSGLGTNATVTDVGGVTNTPSRYYRVRVLVP